MFTEKKRTIASFFQRRRTKKIPDEFEIPNPYNIPDRVQGNQNNCTSLSFAHLVEYPLSDHFKERTLIDIDDLWNKQRTLGTATEVGDYADGPFNIAIKYGVRFTTDSGRTGTVFLTGKKKQIGIITKYVGWKIKMDDPATNLSKI